MVWKVSSMISKILYVGGWAGAEIQLMEEVPNAFDAN